MYAIESKKRKFDRILETIKDHASSRPQTPDAPTRENSSIPPLVESSSTKKRRLDSCGRSSKRASIASSLPTATYLPASREAFLERLETFGPITKWHVPSTEMISAAAWAKRGWWCLDTDTVGCKACDKRLLVEINEEEENTTTELGEHGDSGDDGDDGNDEDDIDTATTMRHGLLMEKYKDMVVTAHAQSCPWRDRGCDESIQRVGGLLSTKSALETLKTRYDSLQSLQIPSVHLPSEDFSWRPQEMTHFRWSTGDPEEPHLDKLKLAMAGWRGSTSREDVAECRSCFRSLGLWLYRGETPIMEKLDAVESHLEYCPWRLPGAQSTSIDQHGERKFVPAWILVARAIKDAIPPPVVADSAVIKAPAEESEPLGEKEREAKFKHLLRRVKDLKKPFNVKALLRKKTAAR